MGIDCSVPCPIGKFGPNCAHECYCHNGATCNPVDGKCKCKAGYAGNRCEDHCPEGYYGEDCYQACQCESENYLCHPTHGCICQPGYGGNNCSTPITSTSDSPYIASSDERASGLVFGAIFTVVIVGVSAVVLLFYYKRSYNRKKSELANVHYMASSEADQSSFQNPMYTTFTQPSPTNSTQRLTTAVGAIAIVKPMRQQETPAIVLHKVQEPVLECNKNVYSAIDELKESTFTDDNIYEELKKRQSEDFDPTADEGYDHLDFTRPNRDLRPHYQSTDSIRSRSRNSSDPSREGHPDISNHSFESEHSMQSQQSDFCQSVLTSVENLNSSSVGTRKTIYEPECDSGISSNRSTVSTVPLVLPTESTPVL